MATFKKIEKMLRTVLKEWGGRHVAKMSNEYGDWEIGEEITALLEKETDESNEAAIKMILKGLTKKRIDKEGFVEELEIIIDEMELPTDGSI
jgi:hypothetical protein